ncbi:uncharacterized protein TM35_000471030 [Trypanosoma theileri]|uniref:Mucin TcMUCII n=1 Tax=Trypanosoma theileri TaxID=67003 RepID=A0A1X0NI59_9TRYP|nr:uncharacterized protein TM35_000471030 [Trypanosoma theileri]ORC84208.1 hypothetical protein TM35_000471030 [Trypanosoma theileri]
MTKAVMVRCYLLCLLTLALCCASGLVWADDPKASESSKCVPYVGLPPFFFRNPACNNSGNTPKYGPTSKPLSSVMPHLKPGAQGADRVITNPHQEQHLSRGDQTEVTVNSQINDGKGTQVAQQTLKEEGTPSGTPGHNKPDSNPKSKDGQDIKPTEEHLPPGSAAVPDGQQSGEGTAELTQSSEQNPTVSASATNSDDHRSPHENTSPLQEQEEGGAPTQDSQVTTNTDDSQESGNTHSPTNTKNANTPTKEESTTTIPSPLPNEDMSSNIASTMQKKSNVDSSISPVWMRTAAPLLIVVVLFSATVY